MCNYFLCVQLLLPGTKFLLCTKHSNLNHFTVRITIGDPGPRNERIQTHSEILSAIDSRHLREYLPHNLQSKLNVCYMAILQYIAVCFLDEAIRSHTHDDNGLCAVCLCVCVSMSFADAGQCAGIYMLLFT